MLLKNPLRGGAPERLPPQGVPRSRKATGRRPWSLKVPLGVMLELLGAAFEAAWLVVVYLFGFKLFRWMTSVVTALLTGIIAFVVVGLVVVVNSEGGLEQALKEGIAIALLVSLLMAAGGFAFAHFFQHVAAAFVGSVTLGGLAYLLGRLLMAQVMQDVPSEEAKVVSMAIAVVMALVVAAVVIVVAILYYDYFGAVWMVVGSSVSWYLSQLSYSIGRTGQSLWRSGLGGASVLEMLQDVFGDIGSFIATAIIRTSLSAVAVIGLRALCWDSPTSLQVVRLRPELRPAIFATSVLLFWDMFWSRLLPGGVFGAWIDLWPLMLVAFSRFLLPLGERQPGQSSGRARLPAGAFWIKYVVVLGVGLPLCGALFAFVVSDLPRIALGRPSGFATATLRGYYSGFFVVPSVLQGGSGSILTMAIKWVSIGLLGPVVLDWARRATPVGAVRTPPATDATPAATAEAPATPPRGGNVSAVLAPGARGADVVALSAAPADPTGAAATRPHWLLALRRRWEEPTGRRRLLGAAVAVGAGIIAVAAIASLRGVSVHSPKGTANRGSVANSAQDECLGECDRAAEKGEFQDCGSCFAQCVGACYAEFGGDQVGTLAPGAEGMTRGAIPTPSSASEFGPDHGSPSAGSGATPRPEGLPDEIPRTRTRPPTVKEWVAAPRIPLEPPGCFRKAVREWLKLNCSKGDGDDPQPQALGSMQGLGSENADYFIWVRPGTTADLVARMVPGRRGTARLEVGTRTVTIGYDWSSSGEFPLMVWE